MSCLFRDYCLNYREEVCQGRIDDYNAFCSELNLSEVVTRMTETIEEAQIQVLNNYLVLLHDDQVKRNVQLDLEDMIDEIDDMFLNIEEDLVHYIWPIQVRPEIQ